MLGRYLCVRVFMSTLDLLSMLDSHIAIPENCALWYSILTRSPKFNYIFLYAVVDILPDWRHCTSIDVTKPIWQIASARLHFVMLATTSYNLASPISHTRRRPELRVTKQRRRKFIDFHAFSLSPFFSCVFSFAKIIERRAIALFILWKYGDYWPNRVQSSSAFFVMHPHTHTHKHI